MSSTEPTTLRVMKDPGTKLPLSVTDLLEAIYERTHPINHVAFTNQWNPYSRFGPKQYPGFTSLVMRQRTGLSNAGSILTVPDLCQCVSFQLQLPIWEEEGNSDLPLDANLVWVNTVDVDTFLSYSDRLRFIADETFLYVQEFPEPSSCSTMHICIAAEYYPPVDDCVEITQDAENSFAMEDDLMIPWGVGWTISRVNHLFFGAIRRPL
jgi:hypothetical protein